MALRMGIGLGLSRSAMLPALSLGFLGEALDPRITFSRGSNATLVDATGKITYAPANLLAYSQEFDNTYWLKTGAGTATAPVVTANAGTAPNGTNTAERVQFDCVNAGLIGNRSTITPVISYPAAVTYVASVWVKAFDAGNVGKTIRFAVDGVTNAVFTITADWQRISLTGLASIAVTNFILEARGTFTTQTADILVWGAQLEPVTYQTTPSPYVATTASAYYGPRFDYDPVTLAPKGLLIEEARTNLLTYSEQFDNAAWIKTNLTVTANATASPDGTTNADSIVPNATNANHPFQQTFSYVSGQSYTHTIYAKQSGYAALQLVLVATSFGANIFVAFDLANGVASNGGGGTGVSQSITAVGNGWYRCSVTATATVTAASSTQFRVMNTYTTADVGYAGNGTSGIFIWGAQLEAGSFATSYIPTVASTVTRSADVATMTGTNFSSWYNPVEGTFVVDATTPSGSGTGAFTASSTLTDYLLVRRGAGAPSFRIQTTAGGVEGDFGTIVATGKTAATYRVNDFAVSSNGGAVSVDTAGQVPLANKIDIGSVVGQFLLNGHIRSIAYYNTRLPNAQLQSLTA